ncbi:hypothetical protein K443DRAFT_90537, partial [Laccaria amethystina LaAM-08-1]
LDISLILSGLWALKFVTFCLDWPPAVDSIWNLWGRVNYTAVGPKIHIFCPDRDQGFSAGSGFSRTHQENVFLL